jgi:hypothetical protein
MTNWQDDLLKKEHELNLREVKNGETADRNVSSNHGDSVGSNSNSNICNKSSNSDNIIIGRSRNVLSRRVSKEINNRGKEETLMIPSKGLFDDYNAIDKENISVAEKVWKYIPKLLKVILNTRTNTVKIMDKLGIPRDTVETVKPKSTPVEQTTPEA